MIKLQQKTSGYFRAAEGARAFCRLKGYLLTARKRDYSLLHALERARVGKQHFFLSAGNPSTT